MPGILKKNKKGLALPNIHAGVSLIFSLKKTKDKKKASEHILHFLDSSHFSFPLSPS